MEIWKDVNGYENYQVSNFGIVKSKQRFVSHFAGGKRIKKEKILKLIKDKDGYYRVMIYDYKVKPKSISIHQLVAMCFLNHKPNKNTLVVNHINFNKTDNRLENLEIVTNRENTNKKHIKSASLFTGVSFHRKNNKWQSEITIAGKSKYLGCFNTEIEASEAYQVKLKEIINVKISN
jgi:hypothetical protein